MESLAETTANWSVFPRAVGDFLPGVTGGDRFGLIFKNGRFRRSSARNVPLRFAVLFLFAHAMRAAVIRIPALRACFPSARPGLSRSIRTSRTSRTMAHARKPGVCSDDEFDADAQQHLLSEPQRKLCCDAMQGTEVTISRLQRSVAIALAAVQHGFEEEHVEPRTGYSLDLALPSSRIGATFFYQDRPRSDEARTVYINNLDGLCEVRLTQNDISDVRQSAESGVVLGTSMSWCSRRM